MPESLVGAVLLVVTGEAFYMGGMLAPGMRWVAASSMG